MWWPFLFLDAKLNLMEIFSSFVSFVLCIQPSSCSFYFLLLFWIFFLLYIHSMWFFLLSVYLFQSPAMGKCEPGNLYLHAMFWNSSESRSAHFKGLFAHLSLLYFIRCYKSAVLFLISFLINNHKNLLGISIISSLYK